MCLCMSQDVLTSDLNWYWTSSNENIKNQKCLSSTVIEAYMKYAVNGSNMSLKSSTKLHVRTQSWKCNCISIRKDSGCNDTTAAIALDRWNKLIICLTKRRQILTRTDIETSSNIKCHRIEEKYNINDIWSGNASCSDWRVNICGIKNIDEA